MINPDFTALEWYLDMGVDIGVASVPNNRFSKTIDVPTFSVPETSNAEQPNQADDTVTLSIETVAKAKEIAAGCQTLDDLQQAIQNFEDYPFKKTATNLVFGQGDLQSKIMIIGDPPSRDEDRSGRPFDGAQGALLDKMLASISLSREVVYLSHIMHYPTPGNRTPTPEHLAICKPFVARQIEIVAPDFILLFGIHGAKSLCGVEKTMSRVRGEWLEYGERKTPALVTYAPDYLMNNPLQKRKAWHDLLSFQEKIHG